MNRDGEKSGDGNWHLLLHGLSIEDSPLALVPGLTLRRIEDQLSVFDLAAAGSVGFREWALLEPFAPGCKTELVSALDAATLPGFDTLNRAWLASNMLSLLGHTNHRPLACSRYSWSTIAGHQKRTSHVFKQQVHEEGVHAAVYSSKRQLPQFHGQLLDYHIRPLSPRECRTGPATIEDAQWINQHFDIFNRLASEEEPFRYALIAVSDWRYSNDPRAAMARLWSGIESLFGISSELVYRLAITSASLLTPRGEPRVKKFRSIKKLYGIRSKAVHGAYLSDQVLAEATSDSFQLLRELILNVVERGRLPSGEEIERALFC